MKYDIKLTRRPLIASNMSNRELVREAEFAFPNPTPIIKLMIERLAAGRSLDWTPADAAHPHQQPPGVNCPACGAELQINFENEQ